MAKNRRPATTRPNSRPSGGQQQPQAARSVNSATRPTKAEAKRERAEAARQALLAAQRRERYRRYGLWGAVVLILAVTVTVVVLVTRPSGNPGSTTTAKPAMSAALGRTTAPPWAAPSDAAAAVGQAGLQMLGAEGTALHIHAHLDVIVDGQAVNVPAEIGIDTGKQQISALHTHDTSGVIHIESPVANASFTLGQFFTEWQVSMSADHLGGLPVDATHHLTAYVNGEARTGDPAAIVLAAHDEIAIVYGTDAEKPTIPTSYQWTNGL